LHLAWHWRHKSHSWILLVGKGPILRPPHLCLIRSLYLWLLSVWSFWIKGACILVKSLFLGWRKAWVIAIRLTLWEIPLLSLWIEYLISIYSRCTSLRHKWLFRWLWHNRRRLLRRRIRPWCWHLLPLEFAFVTLEATRT
jgi:hypothetical protein